MIEYDIHPAWGKINDLSEEQRAEVLKPQERIYLSSVITALGYKTIRDIPREKLDNTLEQLMMKGLI